MLRNAISAVRAVAVTSLLVLLVACGSGVTTATPVTVTPVTIATASLPAATVGTAYSSMITASGGSAPYLFGVTSGSLPNGVSLEATGLVSGVPTASGTYSFTVTVSDADSQHASTAYSVTVAPETSGAVSILTTSLPAGTQGAAYSATIVATNGTAPYTFAVTAGSLPAGLSLSSGGVLSGIPTATGASSFTVTVTDATGARASAAFSVSVSTNATPVSITTGSLPAATVGIAYSATIAAANGTAPYSFALTTGSLPAGLSLSSAGVLAGTPTASGVSSFTVTVTDANGGRASASFSVSVTTSGSPVSITTSSLPGGTVGTAYSATIAAANGTAPYSFAVTSGALPAGLSLSTGGVISGTPTTAETSNFTVTVTDAGAGHASASFSVTVGAAGVAVSITTSALPSGTVGTAYSATIAAANGTTPYSFAVTAGSLPAGLSLSSAGVLSGTPTTAETSNFTVTVTDANGGTASASFSVTVAAGATLTITTGVLPGGVVGAAYSATIAAANGTAPYSFAVTGGALPAGLSLSTAGVLSGTPTTAAPSTFTVTVTDANAKQATATLSINVIVPTPVSIVTGVLPSGTVGTAYAVPVLVANGTAPYSFAVTGGALPAGLGLSASGVVMGTPTTVATSTFTVTVTDANGTHASATYSVSIVAAGGAITITSTGFPNGTVGVPYNGLLTWTGGVAPIGMDVTSGTLPPGLTLWADGIIGGTPTTAGTYSFWITVIDNNYQTASMQYTVTIAPAFSLATAVLPPGTVGTAYSTNLLATNGTAPYTYTLSAGALPGGLTLPANGVLAGTPTGAGTFSFTVTANDAAGLHASANFVLAVAAAGAGLTISNTSLSTATLNAPYSWPLGLSGGTSPYTVTLTSGILPNGLTLSSNGLISGTPTATGTYTVGVTVTDSSATPQTATTTLTLTVATATVAVNTAATVVTVPQTFFGMHTSVYDGSLNDVNALPALLQGTGITMLRYPGGSYSDRYHWAQHSLTPAYASTPPACGIGGPTFEGDIEQNANFGDFVKTMLASGASAVITVNYGTSVADSSATLSAGNTGEPNHCSEPNTQGQPEEAAAWVAYANGDPSNTQVIGLDSVGFDWQTVGFWAGLRAANPLANDDGYNFLRIGQAAPLGIKYWELGNEMYYNGWSGNRNYEADLHAPFIYPQGYFGGPFDSRDQLPALSPTAYGSNAAPFFQAMKAVDPTIQVGVDFASPGATDPIPLTWNPDLAQAACAATNFDFAIIHYYPGTYQAVEPSELLSLPESDLPRQIAGIQQNLAQYCPGTAATTKFLLTETSPNGTLENNFPQPVLGLFALNEYLESLQLGVQNIDWLELHNGTYLDDNENPGPVYYGLELAHFLASPGDALVQAQSSSASVLSWATAKANGTTGLMLVNADPNNVATVQVTVAGASVGSTATEYSYGISTNQNGSVLQGTSLPVSGSTFTVSVPAFTAVELDIP